MLIIYVIDLSTKNKNVKTGVHIFTKIKNTDGWKQKKKYFSVISFQKFLIFPKCAFSEDAQCFVGVFLSVFQKKLYFHDQKGLKFLRSAVQFLIFKPLSYCFQRNNRI